MAAIALTVGDAVVISSMIKSILDVLSIKRKQAINLDDLVELCQTEEVRSMVLDNERGDAVARFLGTDTVDE